MSEDKPERPPEDPKVQELLRRMRERLDKLVKDTERLRKRFPREYGVLD